MNQDLNQFVIRPFAGEDDFPRLLRLRTEIEAFDHDGTDTQEEALRAQMAWAGHDPLQDRWVVEAPGEPERLIAHALVWAPPREGERGAYTGIAVRPNWRRKGIGAALLAHVLDRARALGVAHLLIDANVLHLAVDGFLSKHGFAPAGAYTEMRALADTKLPSPIFPYGYSAKTYAEVQDLSILTQAMNRSYEGFWGHHEVSETQMAEWLPKFTPEALFLIFSPSGKVVGVSRVEVSKERTAKNGVPTGYIDAPGIVPQHRRLDLYRAMLLTGVRWLQGQGQRWIELESWGDRAATLDMYRELGFSVLRQVIEYRLEL